MIFTYKGAMVDYELIKSNRKSVEIQLKSNGQLVIKGPKKINQEQCEKILMQKWDWILENLEKFKERQSQQEGRTYMDEEIFYILEEKISLKILRQNLKSSKLKKIEREWILSIPSDWDKEKIIAVLIPHFKSTLKKYLEARIKYYEPKFSKKVKSLTIRNQSTKWGSCSSKQGLNFNYRLIFAPLEIIDYLVVHEMSHLEHMNHSKSYWKKVYTVMSDYEKKDQWLKKNGHKLSVYYDYKI
jgi:hypothetical protein